MFRWRCKGQTDDERFQRFDCDWVGNWLRPGTMRPRRERDITHMNRDEYVDSVELAQVRLIRQRSCSGHCLRIARAWGGQVVTEVLSFRGYKFECVSDI